jgi:hypothetical protein
MTAALTPALTLDYVHTLSADIRAAVVLGADGTLLAGPEPMGTLARALLDAAPHATALEGSTPEGAVYAARDADHAIVAATGPHALARLTRHDLRAALAALGGAAAGDDVSAPVPAAAVSALLSAAEDGFRRPRAV